MFFFTRQKLVAAAGDKVQKFKPGKLSYLAMAGILGAIAWATFPRVEYVYSVEQILSMDTTDDQRRK
jgi:hypothetical protein